MARTDETSQPPRGRKVAVNIFRLDEGFYIFQRVLAPRLVQALALAALSISDFISLTASGRPDRTARAMML